MSEKKDSKGRAKIVNIGTFDEADRPQGWTFDRQGRVTDWGNHVYKICGYTNAELHKIAEWSEKRENAIPDAFEVAAILTDEPAKVESEATAPTNAETTNTDDDEIDASWTDLPETQDIKTGRDDRVPGKREDVFFNFSAHLDQIVLKDKVTLKMTTSELPESILSNGEVINLSKAAYNEVDVEIRISYWINAACADTTPLDVVIKKIEAAEPSPELPLETPVDAAQDAVLSESSAQTDIPAPEAQAAPIETPVPEEAPAAEQIAEAPVETVPAENVTPAEDTVTDTSGVDF